MELHVIMGPSLVVCDGPFFTMDHQQAMVSPCFQMIFLPWREAVGINPLNVKPIGGVLNSYNLEMSIRDS